MAEESKRSAGETPQQQQQLTNSLAKTWLKQYFDDSNFPEWTKSRPGITSALLLPERRSERGDEERKSTACMLCDDESFALPKARPEFLLHLLERHRLVIGHVDAVADLAGYATYWKRKFAGDDGRLSDFCTLIKFASGAADDDEREFHFLSDVLAEDMELRKSLQLRQLQRVLDVQERERNDVAFERSCLFCRSSHASSKSLFDHMAFDHNFGVGHPDNLVHVNELMDVLEKKMSDFVCIFCEKIFKNRDVMKEHMRKKGHKKINPRNADYDRFYVVNYLEFGKKWSPDHDPKEEEDEDDDDEEGRDLAVWPDLFGGTVCLFCPAIYDDVQDLFRHLDQVHLFDYESVRRDLKLSFYKQVKLINYIRRQVYLNSCLCCDQAFETKDQLLDHMALVGHLKPPPDRSEWDQSQYFFPTYENDNLLCALEGDGDLPEEEEAPVVAEELELDAVKDSILHEQQLRSSLVSKNGGKRQS